MTNFITFIYAYCIVINQLLFHTIPYTSWLKNNNQRRTNKHICKTHNFACKTVKFHFKCCRFWNLVSGRVQSKRNFSSYPSRGYRAKGPQPAKPTGAMACERSNVPRSVSPRFPLGRVVNKKPSRKPRYNARSKSFCGAWNNGKCKR